MSVTKVKVEASTVSHYGSSVLSIIQYWIHNVTLLVEQMETSEENPLT